MCITDHLPLVFTIWTYAENTACRITEIRGTGGASESAVMMRCKNCLYFIFPIYLQSELDFRQNIESHKES